MRYCPVLLWIADIQLSAAIMNIKEVEDSVIEEEVIEYKLYKEKHYLNSDRDPLGITLNGKVKSIFMLTMHSKI